MVKMRLLRMGDKKNPIYRIVVVDGRKAMSGEYIECVGHYRPTCEPAELTVDVEKAKEWLSKGVQPTETVKNAARKDGRDGEIREAQPFQDQGEEIQEIIAVGEFKQASGGKICWI